MNQDIINQKKKLRRQVILWRQNISTKDREEWDSQICMHVLSSAEFKNAKCISGYIPYKGETDTSDILKTAIKRNKKVVLPVTDVINHKMCFREILDFDTLSPGGYGILEPPETNSIIPLDEIDFSIIPGVAFSMTGARLGYGGGYFDNILMKMNCLKFAAAYNGQVFADIPINENDIMMDCIVTEKGILRFY